MNLNEINWNTIKVGDKVVSNQDQVHGVIHMLETTPTNKFITILWSSDIMMRFDHNWTTEITYLGV